CLGVPSIQPAHSSDPTALYPAGLPGGGPYGDGPGGNGRCCTTPGDGIVFDGAGSFTPYESETTLKRFRDTVLGLVGITPEQNAVAKRVIGIEGDTVECCDDAGRIVVNGAALEEPYLAEPSRPASSSPFDVEVTKNRVFLLGDNRYDSIDSRALFGAPGGGMIQVDKIYGPVKAIR